LDAIEKKSVSDQSSFCPVVPRWNGDRLELHWYGWGGPIDELEPLCDLTKAQGIALIQMLNSAIYKKDSYNV
jgi:hypothetical protein